MVVAMTVAQRKRQALVNLAQALSTARLQMALAELNGRTRLGKLLEAAEAEVFAVADREALEAIAEHLYADEVNRVDFMKRQLEKRVQQRARANVVVRLQGRGLGIGIDVQDRGKAVPDGQGALPFAISGDGAASL